MKKKRAYRFFKWIAGIILFLILLITGISWYLVYNWEPLIKSRIKNSITTATDSLYTLEFGKIRFNLALGNFRVSNVWLRPDTAVYARLKAKGTAPAYLYEVKVDNIYLNRSHPLLAYSDQRVLINEIRLDNPELKIVSKYGRVETEDTSGVDIKRFTPYSLIKGVLKSIDIKAINFNNVSLTFVQEKTGKDQVNNYNFSKINILELFIDSMAQYNKEKPFYTDDIKLVMNDFNFPTKDSSYFIKFQEAVFSSKRSALEVYNFKFEPRYDEVEHSKRFDYRVDRFDIRMGSFILKEIDIQKLFYYQRLYAGELYVNKLFMYVYDNMQVPKSEEKIRSKPFFPLQTVQKIAFPFTIQNIFIKNSEITYSELDKNTSVHWTLPFKNFNSTVNNFSNDTVHFLKHPYCVVKSNASVAGEGELTTKFTFRIDKRDGDFSCIGSLKNFRLNKINYLVVPLQKIELSSGRIKKMDFSFSGNVYGTKAKMEFYYNDLRIKILKMDESENRLRGLGLVSFLANAALLNRDNPGSNGKMITQEYRLERKPEFSFFGLLWRTLFRGMKNTVGITQEVENDIVKRITSLANNKRERIERKEERKENRERRKERRQIRKQEKISLN